MHFLINFNRGQYTLCPMHYSTLIELRNPPFACGICALLQFYMHVWDDGLLSREKQIPREPYSNTQNVWRIRAHCSKNNWNAAFLPPPLANNVLAKCRPTNVNTARRRHGFGSWLPGMRGSLAGSVSSEGPRWGGPTYKRTCGEMPPRIQRVREGGSEGRGWIYR